VKKAVLAGALLSLAGLAYAQSLGEAARQEQAKKKPQAAATPAPSYGDDDLRSRAPKHKEAVTAPVVTASPSAKPTAEPTPEPESERAVQEREWRARFAEARARIAEADANAYEDRVEVVYHDGVPVQQHVRVKIVTPELVEAKKALEDLEEELRRAGGLPGWGRE
jgi:hypothetical protein